MVVMSRRELARNYFKECNLTYDDINMNDIYKLIQILNVKITETNGYMLMIKEPKLRGRNTNIKLNKNGKLVFAEIRVKGTYFDDREAITFNEDGFIGLCGWADGYNLTPFVIGFKDWCDYMKIKTEVIDYDNKR